MDIKRIAGTQVPETYEKPVLNKEKKDVSSEPKDSVRLSGREIKDTAIPKPAASPAGSKETGKKKWTILIYSAADNNLMSAMRSDLDEVEAVGSDNNTNLVAQFDGGRSEGVKRYFLDKSPKDGKITSPALESLGSQNMADPKVLTDFIKWGIKQYPSEHVMLIISDHGGGWSGAISDDSHGGWMNTPQIAEALKKAEAATGKKIDVLGFDACLMASTEVAHELKDNATYLVASQETEGADGWPYTKIMSAKLFRNIQKTLKSKLTLSPEKLAQKVVDTAQSVQGTLPTMSAIDMTKVDALSKTLDKMAVRLMETDTPASVIKDVFKKAESFDSMKDVYDIADKIENNTKVSDEELKKIAAQVKKDIEAAVIAEQHSSSYPNAHGLHIEAPSWNLSPSSQYKELAFAKDTKWDEALSQLDKKYLA
ncbi:MAG: clostripain-related cysteine peptidase [Chloroflexi bacterium]|nr:clostripain-related cysteine peptidase [Chloroflexota bacterium]